MADKAREIGITLAYIVAIIFMIGAIIALAVDLIPAPHTLSYENMTSAIVAVIVGIVIIVALSYLFDRTKTV